MKEKQLEEKLIRAVKAMGGMAYKFVSPGRVGVPDRLVILPGGKMGFVEVKKPKQGRLSKVQQFVLKQLTALGCRCYVLDDLNEIEFILEDIKK